MKVWRKLRFFQQAKEKLANGWSSSGVDDRDWENMYRQRWQHDKVVRTTHGVNCTGSCSWKVFVKNGLITWEHQQRDYPSTGPDMPEVEPRGCPRGASFSWYVYSPLRVRFPYVRRVLLELWHEALKTHDNPLDAWQSIVEDPVKSGKYKKARGKGGFLRSTWDEVYRLMAAQMLYTIKTYGPDRIAGFTPIPAMSMVSYAAGARFISLLGGPMLSFYDWYADLPPASPQIWGEQTDVPESSDWYNSGYIIMWGSNVPLTRTPDAHFMTEVRYKGTKVVAVSPDYAENVKFADSWMAAKPGSDGALAQAMTHVILKEFYVNNPSSFFIRYVKNFTDLPFLVTLQEWEDCYIAGRFLLASDLQLELPNPEWQTVVYNELTGQMTVPNGSIGMRWADHTKWNLKQEDVYGQPLEPVLSLLEQADEIRTVAFPYFDGHGKGVKKRNLPVRRIRKGTADIYVTTVYDLMLAHYGVSRGTLSENYPQDYDDPEPYTPAWQEPLTGVPRQQVIQIAREFAENAEQTQGRSMIIMGAGVNHWFNSDTIYRAILNLVLLTGSEGVNGGGWAHYVGQEKCRPVEGWGTIAFARDWSMPPRLQNATSFFYFATDQWRYEELPMSQLTAATVGKPRYEHPADYNVMAAQLGWLPSYPQFNVNNLHLTGMAHAAGAASPQEVAEYVAQSLKEKKIRFAIENPDDPQNFPRTLWVWRSNLLSSSGKGHEYFMKHLIGASHGLLAEENDSFKPEKIDWQKAAEGKLDLLINIEFRMTGTALHSDILLPAATWYEKHDLSSTDMHPFVHPFNPAIDPPWEAKTDWNIFRGMAKVFSEMAGKYFPGTYQDLVAVPLMHDSVDEIAQPFGRVGEWSKGEVAPIPGKTMPKLVPVERDYGKIYDKYSSLGPLVEKNPVGAHGISFSVAEQYQQLKAINGTVETGFAEGKPRLETARQAAEAMLILSSATNGKVALKAWEAEEKKTGLSLKDISEERAGERITFDGITAQPQKVIPTPVFTGSNKGNRRYSPFTTNIERLVAFRTLTGRQQFYLDHEVILEYGEGLPIFKPTLPLMVLADRDKQPLKQEGEIVLRYLTPHGKWNLHSTYQDNIHMLTLFRGGPHIWLNDQDAQDAGIADNDWIELYNRNGVVVARAVISHRMPRGTTFMYHAQDKHINMPGSEITKERGGTHNSPTRIHIKPTQCIGGYAQLSYGFNYYGPIGNQRDLYVSIRKLNEVNWLED